MAEDGSLSSPALHWKQMSFCHWHNFQDDSAPLERPADRRRREFAPNSQFDVTAAACLGKLKRGPCRYLLCPDPT
ncbi:hypothetical protein GN956_G10788 [Arapaima gigas]